MAYIDGGEILTRALQAEGLRAVFSISDIASGPFLRSVESAGITKISPRHESAAVHMADAWARSTGEMAVAVGAAGPGVANMVPGLMCAWKTCLQMTPSTPFARAWCAPRGVESPVTPSASVTPWLCRTS